MLDFQVKLKVDAEQARRAIYGGTKMARRRFQQGSLFQRGRRQKVWVARWWEENIDGDGSIERTRRAEVLGTVAELPSRSRAMEAMSQRLSAINTGIRRPQSTRRFSDFVRNDWIPVMLPTLKYATQKHYRYIFDVHLNPAFGNIRLCDINREAIQSLLFAKLKSGPAWKTVKHIRGVMGRALSVAEDWGYVSGNPALKTKLPRRPINSVPKPILLPDQAQQLAEELSEPARSIALLLLMTGLRIGELFALRWKRVDLTARTIQIAETVYDGHFDTPKTSRSARVIPIGDQASVLLTMLRKSAANPESLVFATSTGRPLNRHDLLRRHFRPACKKLGLSGITWHSLRHTHATMLDAAGAPLGTVQAQLGHSTPEMTREIYLHSIPSAQRQAVTAVEALVCGLKRTQVSGEPQQSA
jgi:integrase